MSPEGCLQPLDDGGGRTEAEPGVEEPQTPVAVSMNPVPSSRTYSRLSPVPSPMALHHATFRQAAVRSSRARPRSPKPQKVPPPSRADQGWTLATTLGEPCGRAVAAPEAIGAQAAGP